MRRAVLFLPLAMAAGCSRKAVGAAAGDAAPATATGPTTSSGRGPGASEQAVIVELRYGQRDLTRLHALEDRLDQAITEAGVGQFDGDEVAADGSSATLYAYGPDADRLFATMRPILEGAPFARGATVTLRYGIWHEGMRETQTTIGASP